MFLSHLKPTMVTYFRTSLDPMDTYRVGDIINHDAPADTSTPAAALATHLREVNPRLRWHTRGEELADRIDAATKHTKDPQHMIMDAVTVVDSHGNSFVAAEIRGAIGIMQSARVVRLYCVPDQYAAHYVSGCSTGITHAETTAQIVPPYSFTVDSGAKSAGRLAARSVPFVPSSEVQLGFVDDKRRVTATEPDAVQVPGFVQVPWTHGTWSRLYRPEIGHDIVHDTDTDIESAPAIMSAVLQGAGEPALLTVLDATERDEHA